MPKIPAVASVNGRAVDKIAPQLVHMAVDIDSLVPDANNARVHPEMNMETIRASLVKYGQVHPLLCVESTRVIIAGNGRWKAAKDLGWTKIAAHFVPLGEIEAAGLGLADNRSAELAKWDFEVVKRIQIGQAEYGDKVIGWDDDYINALTKMPDWNPRAQVEEGNGQDTPVTVSIKMTLGQRELLESCLAMIKGCKSDAKKTTDATALTILLEEWLLQ